MSRKWNNYADCVRGYAGDKDAWLRTYQIQNEEDAIEIASALIMFAKIDYYAFRRHQWNQGIMLKIMLGWRLKLCQNEMIPPPHPSEVLALVFHFWKKY